MTMLAYTSGRLHQPAASSAKRAAVEAVAAHERREMIRRIALYTATMLVAGGALTSIIAFKTAIYLWRFHYF